MGLLEQLQSMTLAEVAGFALTLSAIWLAARNHRLTWPLQMLAGVLYIWLFCRVNLFGEAALNGLYVVLAAYGWRAWRHGDATPDLPITPMNRRDYAVLLGMGGAGTVLVAQLQLSFLPTDLPWLDSTVFVFGVLAQWLQARRKLQNWLLWIALDILAAGIYLHKDLHITALLYVLLAGLAAYGWLDWRKRLAQGGV